ncbi:unnamed protein product [Protopolystoma xenopodis]|uniref:Uncharacterized protein n=1 Tax=Protopolystoma xenopodis TaxID=117903 RepID=A0A3S5BIH5_9PLAT|nr:unnamed protein product [Protopolystoma xenopodis]
MIQLVERDLELCPFLDPLDRCPPVAPRSATLLSNPFRVLAYLDLLLQLRPWGGRRITRRPRGSLPASPTLVGYSSGSRTDEADWWMRSTSCGNTGIGRLSDCGQEWSCASAAAAAATDMAALRTWLLNRNLSRLRQVAGRIMCLEAWCQVAEIGLVEFVRTSASPITASSAGTTTSSSGAGITSTSTTGATFASTGAHTTASVPGSTSGSGGIIFGTGCAKSATGTAAIAAASRLVQTAPFGRSHDIWLSTGAGGILTEKMMLISGAASTAELDLEATGRFLRCRVGLELIIGLLTEVNLEIKFWHPDIFVKSLKMM